jgi:hypothetical protein
VQFDSLDSSVHLDCSATKDKSRHSSLPKSLNFYPTALFRLRRFCHLTLQHICLLPPSAAGLRPPQAKKLQSPNADFSFIKENISSKKGLLIRNIHKSLPPFFCIFFNHHSSCNINNDRFINQLYFYENHVGLMDYWWDY